MKLSKSILFMPFILALGFISCGGNTGSEGIVPENDESPEDDHIFGQEITVDVSNVIVGKWNIEGFSFGEPDEQDVDTTSSIEFFADGSMDTYTAPPLFNLPESIYEIPDLSGTDCVEFITEAPIGAVLHGGHHDSKLRYEVLDTGSIYRLRIYESFTLYPSCCGTFEGACADLEPPWLGGDLRTFVLVKADEGTIEMIDAGFNFYVVMNKVQ